MNDYHIGRQWVGHDIEDTCPCGKAPCGLVDGNRVDPECTQHPIERAKTLRQVHHADACPAEGGVAA